MWDGVVWPPMSSHRAFVPIAVLWAIMCDPSGVKNNSCGSRVRNSPVWGGVRIAHGIAVGVGRGYRKCGGCGVTTNVISTEPCDERSNQGSRF